MTSATRALHLDAERLRAYSRRANFHSDPRAAAALGFERTVAQGMQVAGPAYGLLLDAWGEDLLAGGDVELRFVAPVLAGETAEASVTIEDASASFQVTVRERDRVAVVGRARRAPS